MSSARTIKYLSFAPEYTRVYIFIYFA